MKEKYYVEYSRQEKVELYNRYADELQKLEGKTNELVNHPNGVIALRIRMLRRRINSLQQELGY